MARSAKRPPVPLPTPSHLKSRSTNHCVLLFLDVPIRIIDWVGNSSVPRRLDALSSISFPLVPVVLEGAGRWGKTTSRTTAFAYPSNGYTHPDCIDSAGTSPPHKLYT